MWTEALNEADVPANSEWRKAENAYYPKDLQEALGLRTNVAPASPAAE